MTLFYYIAADRELPTGSFGKRGTLEEKMIEVYETEEDAAGLYISGPMTNQDSSHLFKKALVYQVNPDGGGFAINTGKQKLDPGAEVTGRKCLTELFHYLNSNLLPGEQVELYSCTAYGTDRFLEPRRKELDRNIHLSEFQLEEDFEWLPRQFIVISK